MTELRKINSKVKSIIALIDLFRAGYLSEPVYTIKKDFEGTTPDIVLWMSAYDFRALIVLANSSGLSAIEVEANTNRWRKDEKLPEDTESFKYIVVG